MEPRSRRQVRSGLDVQLLSRKKLGGMAPALALAGLAACIQTTPAPDLRGQDVHLTVIHTSDVHSRIFPYSFNPNKFDKDYGLQPDLAPYGGAARMATLIKRERAKAARSIHLDSGDCFQGAPVFNAFSGEAEMRAMTALGLDAAALGNHEFDKGPNNLAGQIGTWGGFPILAANMLFQDYTQQGSNRLGQVIKPYTILNVDGLKVGVIGMGNVSSLNSLIEGGNSLGIVPLDTDQTIDYYSSLLRPQVDLLVAVSHLGLDEDENTVLTNQGQKDADNNQVRGDVDVVFGGHLHIVLNPPKLIPITKDGVKTNRDTVLVHSGAFAKTIGRLDLVVHVNTKEEMEAAAAKGEEPRRGYVAAFDYNVIPVTAREPMNGTSCVSPNEDSAGQACTPAGDALTGFCRDARGSKGERKACNLKPDRGETSGCTDEDGPCLACSYCHIPEDGELTRILEPYELQMNRQLDLTRTFATAAVPDKIMRNAPGGGDSQLGNLVASAMRFQPSVQADFALTNSLGIRADFDSGPLTLEDMYNVFPFENTIEVMYLSGAEIQEMLDFNAAKSGLRGCKTQAQVSGVSFVMDCKRFKADVVLVGSGRQCTSDAQCSGEVCGTSVGTCQNPDDGTKSSFAQCDVATAKGCGSGEKCVSSGLGVCGKLLNPQGSYRVAVNDYIAQGGSGFTVLKRNTAKFDTKISLRDALIDYIQRMDEPQFEGPFRCEAGKDPSVETCRGAIRCDDPLWKTNKYLIANSAISAETAQHYCPGKTNVSDCFGNIVCLLPHNQATDGRVLPRLQ